MDDDWLTDLMTEEQNALYDQVDAIRTSLSKYNWSMAAAFGLEDDPEPVRVPSDVKINGQQGVALMVYPTYFETQLQCLVRHIEGKKWKVELAASQTTVMLANGIEVVLDGAMLRGMSPPDAKRVISVSRMFGDVKGEGQPSIVNDGDGVNDELRVKLSLPIDGEDELVIRCKTLSDLELAGCGGSTLDVLEGVLYASNIVGFDRMAPLDGWFILQRVVPKVNKAAQKSLTAIRSYEHALGYEFASECSLSVIAVKQRDHAKIFKDKADAQKAAQAKAKQRGGRRRK